MSAYIPGGHNAKFALNDDEYRLEKNFTNLKDDIYKLEIDMDYFINALNYMRNKFYHSSTRYLILSFKVRDMLSEVCVLRNDFDELEKSYKNNTNISNTQLVETQNKLNKIKNSCDNLRKRIKDQ